MAQDLLHLRGAWLPVAGSIAPTANHEFAGAFWRFTMPGSNMFDAISMTAPIVRDVPTIEATSSIGHPVLQSHHQRVVGEQRLDEFSTAQRVSYAFTSTNTMSNLSRRVATSHRW